MRKAYYDNYDYPKYWKKRDYEHESECKVIKEYLDKIKPIESIAEIGCGFARLVGCYEHCVKNVTLIDPSNDLLEIAKKNLKSKKFKFVQSKAQDVEQNTKSKFDAVLMVRVLHHVDDLNETFNSINKIVNKKGYFILEFANKIHGKNQIKNILSGNFIFPFDIFPEDKRSKKNKKNKSILFLNHHPEVVYESLKNNGFKIIEKRSVSNFRFKLIKKFIPLKMLLSLEGRFQKTFTFLDFGPSIFLLCQKT